MPSIKVLPAALLALLLAGCDMPFSDNKTPVIGVVDVERVMKESVPAEAARKHLRQAHDVLQAGMRQLEKEWKDAPEATRRQVLADGLAALNRQLAAEEAAANAVVLAILREEAEKWCADHEMAAVISKQNLLAATTATDVTAELLAAMQTRVAHFPQLPKVQVKEREAKAAGDAPSSKPATPNAPQPAKK